MHGLPSRIGLSSFGALSLALVLSACAPSGRKPEPPPVDPVAEAVAAGDLRAAAAEYERLAKSERKLRTHYQLLAAKTWRDEGDFVELARVLTLIQRKKLDIAQHLEFDLLSAELAVSQQQFERALALLVQVDVPSQQQARQLELRARAESGLGRPLEAARTRLALDGRLAPTERDGNIQELLSELGKLPAATLLAELRPLSAEAPLRPYLEIMLQRQKVAVPRAPIAARVPVSSEINTANMAYRPVQKLALLLPITGDFGAIGAIIRDGFLAAHFARKDVGKIQVFDSGATRVSALDALQQAIDAGFNQFVGPLERDQVEAVLPVLKPGQEMLALNRPDAGQLVGLNHDRFALAPEEDGAMAAEQLHARGLRRVLAFGTEEDWSMRALASFQAQAEALGLQVLASAQIRSGAVDFGVELDGALKHFVPPPPKPAASSDPQATAETAPVSPHDLGVDAVFIAVRAREARLLVPQLRVRSVDLLPVIAAPQIFGNANQGLDRDLDGVMFMDSSWAHGQGAVQPSRAALQEHLPGAAQSPRLFAFGMDAYLLFSFREYLRAHPGSYLEGASGQLMIEPQGRVRRGLSWFRFADGLPVPSAELTPMRR